MAKEGAPRSQENLQEITYGKIGWSQSVSERNKLVVKGLLEIGTAVGRKITVPVGNKSDGGTVAPPTKYNIDGVEVVFLPNLNFYQAHVDGVSAKPVLFSKDSVELSAEEILQNIQSNVAALKNHPGRRKTTA